MGLCEQWFNKAKSKVLHLGQVCPEHESRLGNEWIGRSSAEKNVGVLVDEKLNMSHHMCSCSLEDQPCPGMNQKRGGQQGEGSDCPLLLCLSEAPVVVLHPTLGPPTQEICGAFGEDPEGHKDDPGVSAPLYW